MEEDTTYTKLPVEERCVHKLWKARVDGYEEALKIFKRIIDEQSPEWGKFMGLIKKFVVDSHAMAQEKGLEATLVFAERCGQAGRTTGDVISGIVTKCLGSPKAKIKDLGFQVVLMYIEIEKHEAVMEELIKGLDNKNPKIVSSCVVLITKALHEFGRTVIAVKPLVKKMATLLADRDKSVRDETKLLSIELFKWIGAALKPQLASVNDVLLKELEVEFDKVKDEKAVPSRYLRSQQEKAAAAAMQAETENEDEQDGDGECEGPAQIDPLDLVDPVEILSKLPKDFYDKLESKKWQERKESLEALEVLLQNPKLENGDYGDVVRALKKVLTKDSNVVLVAMSGKAIASLAKGLGKKFNIYSGALMSGILEKFKEKKTNVVAALREAIDAMYQETFLESMQEDIIEALNNKNPSVKSETALFLARAFTRTPPAVVNKKLLKAYTTVLLKTLNESDPTVRDSSAEALGTLMKLIGEKNIAPFLADVDALKMNKIKECCDKAVITVKVAPVKKERPTTAPSAAPAPRGGSTQPKPVTRPATAGVKKAVGGVKKQPSTTSGGVSKSSSSAKIASGGGQKALPTERDLSQEEVDEKVVDLLPGDVISGLVDSNWKGRLAAVESMATFIKDLDNNNNTPQILVRTLAKKPGFKDTNFQVLKNKLEILKYITETMTITVTTADYVMGDVIDKLGDAKNSAGAKEALTAIAESVSLEYVVSKVFAYIFEQKSPKLQQEGLLWTSNAIREFGFQLSPKVIIDDSKKAVQSINPTVRQAAITLIGTLHLYMGPTLAMMFENEKPALKQQIEQEFQKNEDQKPPQPTKGTKAGTSDEAGDNEDQDNAPSQEINLADLLPRVDIGLQITEALLNEIGDKNWKTRNEGLVKLQGILDEAKLIKPTIGDLPQALAHRIKDSNTKIAQSAIAISDQLATAMGPQFKQYIKVLLPGILQGLGDSKSFLKTACIGCINNWSSVCGYKEFFECEMIAEALKTGGPGVRAELWGWLGEKLPDLPTKSIPKEELTSCITYLYMNIVDRNAEVRKNANDAILGFMIHLGYDTMNRLTEKLTATLKKDIKAALDKVRPNLPVKALPKLKAAPILDEPPKSRIGSGGGAGVKAKKEGGLKAPAAAPVSRKKEEEVDTSPLLAVNNMKHQRMIDEQKLKVLKWQFTQPRDEFSELLRDQMTTANVNKNLMANMFHYDFRFHLKVIDSLTEDIDRNFDGLVSNLDLVLKWMSLRFYDTNPSVILKGLEYLLLVADILIDNEYSMTDIEANSFVPHLLIKIGDPKDAVKNNVRTVLRKICNIYPYAKMFSFAMEGLKSKNARLRTECLDELGYLISVYGITAVQPSPAVALKEIARQISDRDNSVRNAALNCIVQAYFLQGEKIYKLIGQISEKDLSMLDERIKRAKKTRVEPPVQPPPPVKVIQKPESPPEPMEQRSLSEDDDEELEFNPPETATAAIPKLEPRPCDGPFGLDMNLITEIEKGWIRVDDMPVRQAAKVNMDFLYSPLKLYEVNGVTYPKDRLQQLMKVQNNNAYTVSPPSAKPAIPPYQKITANQNLSMQFSDNEDSPMMDIAKSLDPNLVRVIQNVGSTDTILARSSMSDLNDILENEQKQAILRDYEEIYIDAIMRQFNNLAQMPTAESIAVYQQLIYNLYAYLGTRTLCKRLSINSLKSIMSALLGLMAEQKLNAVDTSGITKVINGICVKVLDYANFTAINCALISLLKETCVKSSLPKFMDLLMKCMWRNVKMMPDKSNELDYDSVLYEAHEFLVTCPPMWWTTRPSDTPLRTIRTIIHHMAKMKGNDILLHLNKIPNHSELHTYLIRILKTMGNPTTPLKMPHSQMKDVSNDYKTMDVVPSAGKEDANKSDPDYWIKRLNEFKVMNARISNLPNENNNNNINTYTTTLDSNLNVSSESERPVNIWRLNADSKKTQKQQGPSIKEELENCTDHKSKMELLQRKLAQIQQSKMGKN